MYIVITVFIIIVCLLLSLVVLIQNPKGGGLSSSFGGVGQQILGARRSTDMVEKATWTLAILLLVFSIGSAFFIDKTELDQTLYPTNVTLENLRENQPVNEVLINRVLKTADDYNFFHYHCVNVKFPFK